MRSCLHAAWIWASLAITPACAASGNPPGEASLAATLTLIQDQLNGQGTVVWADTWSDQPAATILESYRMSDVVADAGSCTVKVVETSDDRIAAAPGTPYLEDGQPVSGENLRRRLVERTTFHLRDIQGIRVDRLQDLWNRNSAAAAHSHAGGAVHSMTTVAITPAVYGLSMAATQPVFLVRSTSAKGRQVPTASDYSSKTDTIHFRDEDTADRVAAALRHAIQLCGGEIADSH